GLGDVYKRQILLAATNRPDVLDPALLRPGRFDRQIVVDWPDLRGREGILKVHMKNKPIAEDVDPRSLARGTPGMSGADLANLVTEAALLAARRNQRKILMRDLEEAKDKVMMGAERKSLVLSDEEKRTTAYHESGHALAGWLTPEADPIHKVTVIPRGRALGVTHFLPEGDFYTRTREYFNAKMTVAMGGRAAEQLIFGKITNGAAQDIQSATHLARKMVCEWGMSDRLGPLQFGKKQDMIFLGREISEQKDYSERTAEIIDEEVHSLVQGAYDRALKLLTDNLDRLHALAGALLEREILDREEIDKILKGERLSPPPQEPTVPVEEGATAPAAGRREAREPSLGPVPRPAPGVSPS
ncbi:MAG: AAA family ATPase, partial [Candidatus Eisenbacteria bacterium]|nr:AAA family ATPase [Candidatus Eisenbacteria bacterium]